MRPTPALATAAPARAERDAAQPSAELAGARPGAMRRVVRGRRVQVEMLCANGAWSPLFCYLEPPAGGQEARWVAPGCDGGPHGCSCPDCPACGAGRFQSSGYSGLR